MAKRKAAGIAGPRTAQNRTVSAFPVVAVGASAGGLAAFTDLLKALPAKSGMAYVLIQHLEPNHESALSTLLGKATAMPVIEVTDGLAVEADHVYVIPPNRSMTILHGTLCLRARAGAGALQRPIDNFAISLAEEKGAAAIGVLLSGTGSDGTCGLKAIKAAGGVTFAQEPKTAEWPAMPISAMTAGSVDFVLSPKRIAAELARVGSHPYLAEAAVTPEGSALDKICIILRSATGIDFRLYKQATVRRRIARRMALQKISALDRYAAVLRRNPEEAQNLAEDIFIHVTSFFRDPECFQAVRKRVLTKLVKRSDDDPIRIWIAGCSTGEEAYSLAMLLMEVLGDRAASARIQIFGTDIQERAVEFARAGTYSEAAMSGVSPARRKRFFTQTDHGWQIQKSIRDLCVFARHDLAKDPPFSRLDFISCRNVLIYMGPVLQKRVLAIFQYALRPGGFLFLGNSESISEYSDAFTAEEPKHRIFLRKPVLASSRGVTAATDQFREAKPAAASTRAPSVAPAPDLRREAEAALLEHYTPPALIVDKDLHIVHFQGDTGPYLAPATGQPILHILKMVRPELVVDLSAVISKARRTGSAAHKDGVVFENPGRADAVRLEVQPLSHGSRKSQQDLLIVFQKAEIAAAEPPARGKRSSEASKLARALASTREHLRSLIAERETAQEEMKAANEEVLSSNEELQSTNEELETAKEELQSSNEELITLNDELQHRNAELNVLSQDLGNLLTGVDIPVLVLDPDLRIRRFTPVAGRLLNLIPGDVGRPFSQIASTLNIHNWKELFAEVTVEHRLVEREVTDRSGRRYSLRIRPYKTNEKGIDGVLVVMLDTELISQSRDEARLALDLAVTAEQRGDAILNSLAAHIAVVGASGVITETNDAWNRFAEENGHHPLTAVGPGANYLDVCKRAASSGVAEAQAALDGIEEVLRGKNKYFRLEYACHSPERESWYLMTVSPVKGPNPGAVVAHIDITSRKQAEMSAQQSEAGIHALMESTTQAIIAVSADQKIVRANGATEKMFGYSLSELIGQPLDVLIPEGARRRHEQHYVGYFADMQSRPMGIGLDLEARRKDGTLFPVEIGLGGIDTADGRLGAAFVSDISQRKQAEAALRQSELQYRALFENMMEGLAYCRMIYEEGAAVDFEYIAVNPQHGLITGAGDVIGKRGTEVMPGFRELDREAFDTFARVAATGAPETIERFFLSTQRWYSISLYSPEKGYFVGVFEAIAEKKRLEEELRQNEERLRLAIEGTGMGTFDVEPAAGRRIWSDNARRLYGVPLDAELSDEIIWRGVHPDDVDRITSEWRKALKTTSAVARTITLEFRNSGVNNSGQRWLSVRTRILPDNQGKARRLIGVILDVSERRHFQETIEASRNEVRALAASLLTAEEAERGRVSRELHDRICQQLAVLAIDIGGLAAESPSPSIEQERLKALQARVIRASEETRHIAYELHPTVLEDLGLVAALRELCHEFSERMPDFRLKLQTATLPALIPLQVASCIYRVAEECLNNIVKHSGATGVSLSIAMRKGSLTLTIVDDGKGFDFEAAKGKGGLGLIGIEERTRLVNGRLSVTAGKQHGTRIDVAVPLPTDKK